MVTFNKEDNLNEIIAKNGDTTLIAWFKLNIEDSNASNLLYHDIPKYYTWNKKEKKWCKRVREIDTIGKICFAHRGNDRFYLRML